MIEVTNESKPQHEISKRIYPNNQGAERGKMTPQHQDGIQSMFLVWKKPT